MLQVKYVQKKQPLKGSNSEKNGSSHVSEKTGDEENHGSHEHREDMPVVEVCISFVFHATVWIYGALEQISCVL